MSSPTSRVALSDGGLREEMQDDAHEQAGEGNSVVGVRRCDLHSQGPALGSFSRYVSAQGWAGPIRNSVLLYGAWLDSSDPLFKRVCCYGIAEAVNQALHDARHLPKVSFAKTINQCSRMLNRTAHDANGIWMNDGSHYVFDWWKTLDPNNPFIYRYSDWLLDKNPAQFVNFKGF